MPAAEGLPVDSHDVFIPAKDTTLLQSLVASKSGKITFHKVNNLIGRGS
jgi:hypothetical protein